MNTEYILKNKPIPDDILKRIIPYENKYDEFLFTIQGDLLPDGSYGSSAVFLSSSNLCSVSSNPKEPVLVFDFSDIKKVSVKRMYGNAIMKVRLKDGTSKDIMRFTLSVAELCDSCAEYVNRVVKGEAAEAALEIVRATFQNQSSYCPKCGRRLSAPGVECINCIDKKKLGGTLFKFIKPHLGLLILSLILSAVTTVASLAPPYITSFIVDEVIPNKNTKLLLIIVLVFTAVHFVNSCVTILKTYLLRITGNRIVGDLKKEVYKKAQYLPMKFYDKTSTGSVINRVNADTVTLQQFMMTVTQSAVVQIFTMIGIVAIMLFMNWKLTLISLIPVPFVVTFSKFLSSKLAPHYRRIWKRSSSISGFLSDTIPAIRVVKSFSKEKTSSDKFTRNVDDYLNEDQELGRISSIIPSLIGFLIMCGTAIIWYVGGMMTITSPDELSVGKLVSFITYTSLFYNPINFFATLSDSFQSAITSTERIFDIINAEPEHDFGKGLHPQLIRGKVEFRSVNFSFDRSKKILSDINFVIEPGDVVGIVGTTGSGKSTLINLLMRFYDDYDGEILVDDINIRDIDLSFYREQIGYVQQEPIMFRDSIYNNIAYSKPGASPDEVINVADIANAHGFISRMPDSYDTMLGERGVGLSGGEKQRLSIARAVLKNPAILVFDEATSAMDSETEKLIQDAINNIISGRTTFMIAHRLSTLRKANKIIVVDKGQIIEFGHPDDLMAMKGKYYKLVTIQSMSEKAEADKRAESFE